VRSSADVWALLPVKGTRNAKQRLESALHAEQRELLFLALLQDLFAAAAGSEKLAGVLVVCGDPRLHDLVDSAGFDYLQEPETIQGLNQAASWGLQQLHARGASQALILHGDLPLATAGAIDALITAADDGDMVLVSDWRGDGSNAMLVPADCPFSLSYGVDSSSRHRVLAQAAGLDVLQHSPSLLAFDVDTPQDLSLLTRLVTSGVAGSATRQLLGSWQIDGLPLVPEQQWQQLKLKLGMD
jgi:2-phospho-L-lactate guanylyltransferase